MNRLFPVFAQRRYLASAGSTQTAFELTAGRKAITITDGQLFVAQSGASFSAYQRIVPLDGGRGAMLQLFGNADNATLAGLRVWAVTLPGNNNPQGDFSAARYCNLDLFATVGACTYGSCTGVDSSDLITASEFLADTIATATIAASGTTPKGTGDLYQTAYGLGSIGTLSTANNTPGAITIPNFGAPVHGFVLEFDLNSATAGNALYTITA